MDDGYRAIHLYYQRDNLAYPIEIQLWCGSDYLFNVWSHKHIYKYKTAALGKALYTEHQQGLISTEEAFINRVRELEGNYNG